MLLNFISFATIILPCDYLRIPSRDSIKSSPKMAALSPSSVTTAVIGNHCSPIWNSTSPRVFYGDLPAMTKMSDTGFNTNGPTLLCVLYIDVSIIEYPLLKSLMEQLYMSDHLVFVSYHLYCPVDVVWDNHAIYAEVAHIWSQVLTPMV